MKTILASLLIICSLPLLSLAQEKRSVCVNTQEDPILSDQIVLNICNHTYGMAPRPQPRLYFRLYKSGRVLYEVNPNYDPVAGAFNQMLITKETRVGEKDVAEIIRLCEQQDFQMAKAEYPRFQRWTDSSLKTTIVFTSGGNEKKIVVNNYSAEDNQNKSRYPASLIALLQKVKQLRPTDR